MDKQVRDGQQILVASALCCSSSATSYGGFTPIPGLNPGGTATLTPGTPFQPGIADPTLTIGSLTLNFAFVNVSGCTEGPLNSVVPATPPPVGTVGTSPITVLYVYLPAGNGGGGSGAIIDAFDESTSSLVDNNFVTVSPDPGGSYHGGQHGGLGRYQRERLHDHCG